MRVNYSRAIFFSRKSEDDRLQELRQEELGGFFLKIHAILKSVSEEREKKFKPLITEKNLKDAVNGAGLLCLTLGTGDYISIGASTFVGFAKMKSDNQIRISIVTPDHAFVQRYVLKK